MVCQCLSYPLVERTGLLVSEQGVPIMVAQMLKFVINSFKFTTLCRLNQWTSLIHIIHTQIIRYQV